MNLLPAVVTDTSGGRMLKVGESLIELPSTVTHALSAGRSVTFGVRPEHIARSGTSANATMYPLRIEVLRIEALGAETIVVAQVPGAAKPLFARFPGEAEFRIGERRELFLDLREVHLFGEDGQALWTA